MFIQIKTKVFGDFMKYDELHLFYNTWEQLISHFHFKVIKCSEKQSHMA